MAYTGTYGRSSVLKRVGGIDREKEKANFLALSKPGENKAPPDRILTPPPTPITEKTGESIQWLPGNAMFGGETKATDTAESKVPDRGATVLGIPVDKFSQLAGGLGAALAPNTPMGRVGAFTSKLASQNIAEKNRALERKSEIDRIAAEKAAARETTLADREDARKYAKSVTAGNRAYAEGITEKKRAYNEPLRELQLRSAEKQLNKKETPTEFEAFRSGQIRKGVTDESKIVEDYKKLGRVGAKGPSGEKYPAILKRWENKSNIDDNGNVKSGLVQLKENVAKGDPVALKEYPEVAQQLGRLPKGEVRPIVNNETGEIVYFYPENGKIYNVDGKQIKTPKVEPELMKAH